MTKDERQLATRSGRVLGTKEERQERAGKAVKPPEKKCTVTATERGGYLGATMDHSGST